MAKQKSEQQRLMEAQLARLREAGGELVAEEDLLFEGHKFIIPETMDLTDALTFIKYKIQEDEEEATWQRTFPYRPKDGAVATENALRAAFGAMGHHGTMSFWGPQPPEFKEVEVAYGEKRQVPWGRVSVPAFPDVVLNLYAHEDEELGLIFGIVAEGKKKRRFEVEGLFRLIEAELNERSLYRGKAIDAGYGFIDTERVDRNKVVYAQEVLTQLEANVFARLRHPHALRDLDVPLKGAVLLHGQYGVGKTLAAYLTAQESIEADPPWTFILVRPDRDNLQEAMVTAQMYEPAVVFFEDVDRVASSEQEGDRITNLLDLFDGARAKGREVMAILTTNFVDVIHKGMMRPGRLDAVIEITAPDHAGIIKLVQTILPEVAVENLTEAEWDAVGTSMEEFLPAFVREACDRAVRYLVVREGAEGRLTDDGKLRRDAKLTAEDIIGAAEGLRPQLELMAGASDTKTIKPLEDHFRDLWSQDMEREGTITVRANIDERALEDEGTAVKKIEAAKTNGR